MSSDPVPTIKEMEQAFHDAKVDYLVSTLPLTPEEEEALDEIERQQHYRELAAGGGQSAAPTDAIYDAIDILMSAADDLRECHTLASAPDDWTGEDEAKAEYDRILRCVAALRAQPAAATPDEIEGLRAHVALLKSALAQAERENDELRAQPAAQAQAGGQDAEMVSLGGTAPPVPRWLLDAAQRIAQYMDAHSPGDWAIGGIQKRQASGQAPAASAEPAATVNRETVIEWLDALDIEVTDKQLDGLFHAAPVAAQAPAADGDALEDYKENGAAAVRFAPSSAHWSNELRRLFGPDARDGIDRLEERLRAAEQDAARWRFIRRKLCLTGNGDGTCTMQIINLPAAIPGWTGPGEVIEFCEAAIDAAIAHEQGEKHDNQD